MRVFFFAIGLGGNQVVMLSGSEGLVFVALLGSRSEALPLCQGRKARYSSSRGEEGGQ